MKRTAFLTSTCTIAAALASASALAQPTNDARARYEEERRACMTQNTQDSQATCLREASAARRVVGQKHSIPALAHEQLDKLG